MKFIGSHVSAAGGPHNAIRNATNLKATTFALFLSSPRTWKASNITQEYIQKFKDNCKHAGYRLDKILPHGNYLINLASNDDIIRDKSIALFTHELGRCNELGLSLYNFHPGSAGKEPRDEAIARVVSAINDVHKAVPNVCVVIENMAGQGNVLGKNFTELRDMIAGVTDKSRIGVCLDTCHLFAAGFDISTKDKVSHVLSDFYKVVGKKYLKAFHLNDSMEECGKKKDRHADLGKGHIGNDCFKTLMEDPELDDLVFITETPGGHEIVKEQLHLLHSWTGGKNNAI